MKPTRLVLVAAALIALAGCAPAEDDGIASAGGASTAPSAELSDEEQALEFVECMRDNGIDLPDPEPKEGGGFDYGIADLGIDRTDQTFQDAIGACADKLPGDGTKLSDDPEAQAKMQEFAECMRDNGIDLPDPEPGGGFGGALAEIDRDSPAFQKAFEACKDRLPERGGQ